MSQSATLYRVSKEAFSKVENSADRVSLNIPLLAKGYSLFQGSFMAIEFILCKEQEDDTVNLIREIFNPTDSMSIPGFDEMTDMEKFGVYEEGLVISYITHSKIKRLNMLFENRSIDVVDKQYNPVELNENGIYPYCWSNCTLPDIAYTKRDITEGFEQLKNMFSLAEAEEDYILVFVG